MTAVNSIGPSNESLASYHMMTLREVPSGKPTITAAHNIRYVGNCTIKKR